MGQKPECIRAIYSYSNFVGGMLFSVNMRRNGYGTVESQCKYGLAEVL